MLKRLYYILVQRLYVFRNRYKPCQGKVYMFHNVSDDNDTYSISSANFSKMLEYLCQHKKIVDVQTLINEKDKDNVIITFDDAYESVYKNAYPLLKEKGVPYYVFMCDEFMNKENYLKKEMLKEMLADSKCIIGSHGMKHELSRFVSDDILERNLKESKKKLEDEFGIDADAFAFPYGSIYACSKDNINVAKEIFKYVFMTYNLPYNEEYGNIIPRININDSAFGKEII